MAFEMRPNIDGLLVICRPAIELGVGRQLAKAVSRQITDAISDTMSACRLLVTSSLQCEATLREFASMICARCVITTLVSRVRAGQVIASIAPLGLEIPE